ncbi:hypothetical protein Goshw_014777 [Gossypium schwendimanii]|uniref:Uncharacterized protein n=1 Tax=Gossypium schwendimanii TaxID=34291 RepID=A0A7J9KL81_GOSSC|nr:hypothetical protein [Gossypium schwendimanii]
MTSSFSNLPKFSIKFCRWQRNIVQTFMYWQVGSVPSLVITKKLVLEHMTYRYVLSLPSASVLFFLSCIVRINDMFNFI